MRKGPKLIFFITGIIIISALLYFLMPLKITNDQLDFITNQTPENEPAMIYSPIDVIAQPTPEPILITTPEPATVELSVPYINEAPEGIWQGSWKNACEEASITMVENYYQNNYQVSISQAKEFMIMLFAKQDEIWGSNTDADAQRAVKLINDFTSFKAVIKENPTVAEIKQQLQLKQPVISLHYGKELYNSNIPFLTTGSYYHMMVIIGYDDKTREFITNDDGDIKTGAGHRYDYELFLNSLHDFDFTQRKANGPARVIFTSPK